MKDNIRFLLALLSPVIPFLTFTLMSIGSDIPTTYFAPIMFAVIVSPWVGLLAAKSIGSLGTKRIARVFTTFAFMGMLLVASRFVNG